MTPDNPSNPEAGFMRAAEKAIHDLQVTAETQGDLLKKATRDAALRKLQVRVLGLVSIVLVIVCVLGTVQYFHTRDIAGKVQQGSISQCVDGNNVRAGEIQVWDHVLNALLAPSPGETAQQKAGTVKFVQDTESFITKVYAPKDCTALFGSANANAG